MTQILVSSAGPDSWRQFLAKPETQWVTGYSARTTAHSWEAAQGFPPEVASILANAFGPVELLLRVSGHARSGRRVPPARECLLLVESGR